MATAVDDSSERYPAPIVFCMKRSMRHRSMAGAKPHQAGEAYRRRARVVCSGDFVKRIGGSEINEKS